MRGTVTPVLRMDRTIWYHIQGGICLVPTVPLYVHAWEEWITDLDQAPFWHPAPQPALFWLKPWERLKIEIKEGSVFIRVQSSPRGESIEVYFYWWSHWNIGILRKTHFSFSVWRKKTPEMSIYVVVVQISCRHSKHRLLKIQQREMTSTVVDTDKVKTVSLSALLWKYCPWALPWTGWKLTAFRDTVCTSFIQQDDQCSVCPTTSVTVEYLCLNKAQGWSVVIFVPRSRVLPLIKTLLHH